MEFLLAQQRVKRCAIVCLVLCVFFGLFFGFSDMGNHALWLAMLGFMAMRGMSLGVIFYRQWREERFFMV